MSDMERLLEWLNDEIKEQSEKIEQLGHAGSDRDSVRQNGRMVGFNHGLRHVREEVADRLEDTGSEQ